LCCHSYDSELAAIETLPGGGLSKFAEYKAFRVASQLIPNCCVGAAPSTTVSRRPSVAYTRCSLLWWRHAYKLPFIRKGSDGTACVQLFELLSDDAVFWWGQAR
jgi:hypothetical protein